MLAALALPGRALAAEPPNADWWSLKPFQRQPLPVVRQADWPRGRVDWFLLARMEQADLAPGRDAEPAVLLRRAFFDLIGLPPSLAEQDTFAQAAARDARAALAAVVDRLLASPEFGVRWGRHWLDVARFAESSGNTRNMAYVEAWRFRNYVVRALNRNTPFDQFIREQLAGDLLPHDSAWQRDEQLLATGFLNIGMKTLGEQDLTLYELNLADDQIDATCRAFLALTANCSRCHDHKFDPIPMRDYYALAGIFRSTRNLSAVQTNNRAEEAEGAPLGPRAHERIAATKAHTARHEQMPKDYLEVAKRRKTALEELERSGFDPRKKRPDVLPPAIAAKFAALALLEKEVDDWQDRLRAMKDHAPTLPDYGMAVAEREQMMDCPLYDKGDAKKPLAAVPRGTLQAVSLPLAPIGPRESGRGQLADWIASPRNPLTARVIVNRVWQHVFGRGLVETPDDFGRLGAQPSHPALLDDLAARFVADGWDVKALIRELMLSRAWSLAADPPDARDAGNLLLARANRKPLEAEPLRDAMLALGGTLRLEPRQGSPVNELARDIKPQGRELGRNGFLNDLADTTTHRSIYLPVLRGKTLPVLQCFDLADPGGVNGLRRATIVPAQSLFLMNSDFAMQQARGFAARVLSVPAGSPDERLRLAWRMAFARAPLPTEVASLRRFLGDDPADPAAWSRACQVLLMTGEFRTIY